MKKIVILLAITLFFFSCKETKTKQSIVQIEEQVFEGHWDNFQQYWLENTADDIHRTETDDKHKHFSLSISKALEEAPYIEIREGRNGKTLVEKVKLSNEELIASFKLDVDTLWVTGMKHFKNQEPYKFIRTRKFSGWIEMPSQKYKDSINRNSNLTIHDQGGMAEIDIDGVQYTAELTQLLFAHKLPIMKLAIYDMPMDSVEINSRSISYTWLNPSAKRTGINLRKVVTGWTFIEPGFINSDNTKFEKK